MTRGYEDIRQELLLHSAMISGAVKAWSTRRDLPERIRKRCQELAQRDELLRAELQQALNDEANETIAKYSKP